MGSHALINHPEIILFYSILSIFFFSIFHLKMKLETSKSLVATLAFVFVGSEYYEIPFFIEGYLIGPTPDWLNHIFIIVMFLLLTSILQSKWELHNLFSLIIGPVLTAPILYLFPQYIYFAKMVGFFFLLVAVTTSSEGVGGSKVSKTP